MEPSKSKRSRRFLNRMFSPIIFSGLSVINSCAPTNIQIKNENPATADTAAVDTTKTVPDSSFADNLILEDKIPQSDSSYIPFDNFYSTDSLIKRTIELVDSSVYWIGQFDSLKAEIEKGSKYADSLRTADSLFWKNYADSAREASERNYADSLKALREKVLKVSFDKPKQDAGRLDSLVVLFDASKSRLDSTKESSLRERLRNISDVDTFDVIGYASLDGDSSYNLQLSKRRAEYVAEIIKSLDSSKTANVSYGGGTGIFDGDKINNRRATIKFRIEESEEELVPSEQTASKPILEHKPHTAGFDGLGANIIFDSNWNLWYEGSIDLNLDNFRLRLNANYGNNPRRSFREFWGEKDAYGNQGYSSIDRREENYSGSASLMYLKALNDDINFGIGPLIHIQNREVKDRIRERLYRNGQIIGTEPSYYRTERDSYSRGGARAEIDAKISRNISLGIGSELVKGNKPRFMIGGRLRK